MAKKNVVSHLQKQQTPSMSSSHAHIVGAVTSTFSTSQPLMDEDEDDICPVCESECTCRAKVAPALDKSVVVAPSASSFSTSSSSASSTSPAPNAGLHSLKIKLTLPPNLKFRKVSASDHVLTNAGINQTTLQGHIPHPELQAHHIPTNVSPPAPSGFDAAPKRRGRPPKAVIAAREAAKAAHHASQSGTHSASASHAYGTNHQEASSHGRDVAHGYQGGAQANARYTAPKRKEAKKKTHARTTTGRKTPAHLLSSSALSLSDLSDDAVSGIYPTFVSAASTSSHTSSSESDSNIDSSECDSDSDLEAAEEAPYLLRTGNTKLPRRHSNNDGHRKREHTTSSNWEIRPRKKSVGPEDDIDSGETTDDEGFGLDDETDDEDEEDEEDEDAEADIEGGGLADVDNDDEETSSRIGVSFGGGSSNGWSEDEESSFDADLFFANLEDTSDSDSPPRRDDSGFETVSDMEFSGSLSADEEDALLLMDIDPSVQLRRTNGELEVGFEFDSLAFGWDGQLTFANSRRPDDFDLSFELQAASSDVDMQTETEGSDSDGDSTTADDLLLQESDGETTEDELVDADGLPNSRAMMLFRWPSTVSTINPLSTVGGAASAPLNASESVRIALASITAHRGSPAPTPADILAGKISMDDLEDIEMDKGGRAHGRAKHVGAPAMGEFVSATQTPAQCAVINGMGGPVPSPFPRSKARRRRVAETSQTAQSGSAIESQLSSATDPTLSSAQSSDETPTQTNVPTSELSSTDAIDLDDVLDSSFLDSEPLAHDHESQSLETVTTGNSAPGGTHIKNLSRWDRIPMATFRRTRESVIVSGIESAGSDTGLASYSSLGTMMGNTMLAQRANDKKPRRRSKAKGSNLVIISPMLMPVRDGERTPTYGGHGQQNHHVKTKKELRKEKAMMKRKMTSKPRYPPQHRTHHHHPNNKTRASSSMQRGGHFGSSSFVPPMNL
ncbi:hypothetical protein CERSUDRAFT_112740 [Gelatoporia subvermispora B]|uniref:Uncharacterized protein n=1 Tax=Ceriporiopsis subvermispora (strain B) TaxID=914234 RepID=M2PR44_CERS8|nr:hypothetical protein CERSUDRAFT_112740 [Gelatoporia subvermispora B]